MKGDFTRSTFAKEKHYSSVLMQQGRVQVDSDWNEQMDIQAHLRETQTKDVIGLSGVPGYSDDFKITAAGSDLIISPGRIYVDGILCELEEEIKYKEQTDFPNAPATFPQGSYLVYLDVWQRHITALEDEYIREKALGGPDTAVRSKTLWQVKLENAGNAAFCSDYNPDWEQGSAKSDGKLQARSEPCDSPKPCILPPTAGYQRLENQLYRVEIHKSGKHGTDNPTFKWSRDNGSITAKVDDISGKTIEISHPVPGRLDEFIPDRWIELTDDIRELNGEPGTLVKITEVTGNILTVSPDPPALSEEHNRKIRLWNSEGDVNVEVDTSPSGNDGYIKLEDGVEVRFEAGKYYQTGDYWLIPARTATGDVEWPVDDTKPEGSPDYPLAILPHGIKHHYCKLAIVKVDGNNAFANVADDCRLFFPPLTEIGKGEGCCKVTLKDTDDIEKAYSKMQAGGTLCLLPGVHKMNLSLDGLKNITIRGCGMHTYVIPKDSEKAIITVTDSQFITIENITFVTLRGLAIDLAESNSTQYLNKGLKEVVVKNNRFISYIHAIRAEGGSGIKIIANEIGMVDMADGEVAVSMMAEDGIIAHNNIRVIHLTGEGIVHPDGSVIPLPNDPQLDVQEIYDDPYFREYVHGLWEMRLNKPVDYAFTSPGGILINGGSTNVKISDNLVFGGAGNGITLGKDADDGFLYDITIERNEMENMGLAGIGVGSIDESLTVEGLTIYRNIVKKCLQQVPDTVTDDMVYGGVTLASCENAVIRENRIIDNGRSCIEPICGIYISYSEKVDISDNRILNNGPFPDPDWGETDIEPRSGLRGGIVVKMCVAFRYAHLWTRDSYISGEFGIPALKVHDNIVTQPLGWALAVVAMGPVSVVENQFITQDINVKANPLAFIAGAVLIVDLGVSQNIIGQWFSPKYSSGDNMDAASVQNDGKHVIIKNPYLLILLNTFFGYLFSGGNVTFSNNQTTLDLRGKELASLKSEFDFDFDITFSSQFIFSLDDVSFTGNQSDCNFLIDVLITNTAIFGISVRAADNRFKEGLFYSCLSLFAKALATTVTNNQATHCLYAACSGAWGAGSGNIVLFEDHCRWFFRLLEEKFGPSLKNGE